MKRSFRDALSPHKEEQPPQEDAQAASQEAVSPVRPSEEGIKAPEEPRAPEAIAKGTVFRWPSGGLPGATTIFIVEVETDPNVNGMQDYRWKRPHGRTWHEAMAHRSHLARWYSERLSEPKS